MSITDTEQRCLDVTNEMSPLDGNVSESLVDFLLCPTVLTWCYGVNQEIDDVSA